MEQSNGGLIYSTSDYLHYGWFTRIFDDGEGRWTGVCNLRLSDHHQVVKHARALYADDAFGNDAALPTLNSAARATSDQLS
jgi:hypothetical protein